MCFCRKGRVTRMSQKISVCAFADEAGDSPEEQIAAMRQNGVALLELRSLWGRNVTTLTDSELKSFCAMLHENDLSVWSIGSPCGKGRIDEPFAPQLEQMKRTVEIASLCGAKRIRMFSFYGCEGRWEETRDEVLLRLSRFCEAAEGSGIVLCHENEKAIYGDTAARCLDLLQNLPKLRAVFDPANFLQCGEEIPEAWEQLRGFVDYLHIKDVRADGILVPAGSGEGRLPWLCAQFAAQGGSVMTLEPHLKVFSALSSLEQEGDESAIGTAYASNREAFDAAAAALYKILSAL